MKWNWEYVKWPNFEFNHVLMSEKENQFLMGVGSSSAFLKSVSKNEVQQLIVEILSIEGLKSSQIEGELLDRESLQSSIKKHFGLKLQTKEKVKESGMAHLLYDVYQSYDTTLTHEILWNWHKALFTGSTQILNTGMYRSHEEPMQIVSNRYDTPKAYFEAPPSERVFQEMEKFITWFNASRNSINSLARAAVSLVYFESIHPFEDGNGRIGRLLIEKILSQGAMRPTLIAASKVLERRKKEYYENLERCNHTLDIQHWVDFLSSVILEAQKETLDLLYFLIQKAKLLSALTGKLNERQEKVLLRVFNEGLNGFKGGLSAENYISITKTSKSTATRDLSDLVEKGALVRTGELRHTRYWLNLDKDK